MEVDFLSVQGTSGSDAGEQAELGLPSRQRGATLPSEGGDPPKPALEVRRTPRPASAVALWED